MIVPMTWNIPDKCNVSNGVIINLIEKNTCKYLLIDFQVFYALNLLKQRISFYFIEDFHSFSTQTIVYSIFHLFKTYYFIKNTEANVKIHSNSE